MSLFLKHLLKSMKQRPLQPLMLIISMTVAVFVSVVALSLRSSLMDEENASIDHRYGRAEIEIRLSGESESRFMFAKDAESLLPEGTVALGMYEVLFTELYGNVYSAVSTDLDRFSSVCDAEFIAYEQILREDVEGVVLVSRSFADRHSLSLGDSISARLFDEDVSYRVAAISPLPYAGSYDLLIDVSGVVKLLVGNSVFASALGEDFKPASSILVDLPENYDTEEAVRILSGNSEFSDKIVSSVDEIRPSEKNMQTLRSMVDLVVIITCLLSAVVTFSCFYIISKERSEENTAFVIAGARPALLNFMQYLEAVIYWSVSCVIGIPLAFLAKGYVKKHVGLEFTDVAPDFYSSVPAALLVLVSVLITVTVFVLFSKKKRKKRTSLIPSLIVFAVLFVAYSLLFFLPSSMRLSFGSFDGVMVFLLAFLVTSPLLKRITSAVIKLSERKIGTSRSSSPSATYAVKNLYSVSALHNVCRLIALVLSIILCILLIIGGAVDYSQSHKKILKSDYVMLGGTSRCYEKAIESEVVEDIEKAYLNVGYHENGAYTCMVSVTDTAVLADFMGVDTLPTGNGAYIAYSQSKMFSLDVGDTFVIGEEEFEVEGILSTSFPVVVFDASSVGVDYNMMIPLAASGVSEEQMLDRLSLALADEVAIIAVSGDFLSSKYEAFDRFVNCGTLLLPFIVIFALIGIFNTLGECYRSRKEEFELYFVAGMSHKNVGLMKLCEILLVFGFGIVIGTITFAIALPVFREAMFSMGFDVLRGVMNILGI